MNRVSIIGFLGQDPEINEKFIKFSVAVNESWNDKVTGEKKESTEWIRVVVYSPYYVKAIKDNIKKGTKIFVDGSLKTRTWDDDNGKKNYTTEVIVNHSGSVVVSNQ